MTEQEKVELYSSALIQLIMQNGGEMFVPLPNRKQGSLMNKLENGGVRFRWVEDSIEN